MKVTTYLGAFDDFALRYKLPGACGSGVQELNAMLLEHAFTGVPLALNDGYFINHPALRSAVVKPESSPLCELTESSFISILSRNGGKLELLADDMAENCITSAMYLVGSPFYASDLKPRLERWAETLRSPACSAFRSWPTLNMEASFFKTLEIGFESYIASMSQDDRLLLLRDFWEEFASGRKTRRTEWEDTAKSWQQDGKLSEEVVQELMSLGNQAYQYSWACALTLRQADSGKYRVETNASAHFSQLHGAATLDLNERHKKVLLNVPRINSEYAARAISGRWQLLAEMLRDGHKVNIAKYEFLDRLAEYRMRECSESDMDDATAQYSARLSDHFKEPVSWAPLSFDLTMLTGATAAGVAIGGPFGAAVGFGIGLSGVVAAHGWPGPKLFDMLATPNQKNWFSSLPHTELGSVSASFEVDKTHAEEHLKDVPRFDES